MSDNNEALLGVLRWEAPPEAGYAGGSAKRRPWPIVARDLRDHPGEWGVVLVDGGTNSGSTVVRITGGHTQWFEPAGSFLAVQRSVNGQVIVYAVYLGPNHEYAVKAGVTSALRAA